MVDTRSVALTDFISVLDHVPHRSGCRENMVNKFHGTVRAEARVNFLALFSSKPHNFHVRRPQVVPNCSCAIPGLVWSLNCLPKGTRKEDQNRN